MSLLSSPLTPRMQVCVVLGVSMWADEHMCVPGAHMYVPAYTGEGSAHICVSVSGCACLCQGVTVCACGQAATTSSCFPQMDAIYTHPHTHTHVVTCVVG